jgi:hypothetical protein
MLIAFLTGLLALALQQDTLVVERGRVGTVAIGASAETLYQEFGDRARLIDLKLEGQLSPAIEIKLSGAQIGASLIAEILPSNNRLVVSRINVLDARLRTKQGIGIGSTYADLRSVYSIDRVGSGEGQFFARVDALGMSFQLDLSGLPGTQVTRDPARVPNEARIVGILLTR